MAPLSLKPVSIFYSYAHEDESLLQELDKHLMILKRSGQVQIWHDRTILAGMNWQAETYRYLSTANIILILVSPYYLASEYLYEVEAKLALERHRAGKTHVIPIILHPTDLSYTPFAVLQMLPRNGQAIAKHKNRDKAFIEVVREIQQVIKLIQSASEAKIQWRDEGDSLMTRRLYEDALAAYEQAIIQDPTNVLIFIKKGDALSHLSRYDEALAAYTQTIRLSPNNVAAHLGRGNALSQLGKHDEALLAYEQAIRLAPNSTTAHIGKGHTLRAIGRYKEALFAYDQAISLSPDNAEAHFGKGDVLLHLHQYEPARIAYERTIQLAPENIEAYLQLGNIFLQLSEYEEALIAYDQVTLLAPMNALAYASKAKVQRLLGREEKALIALETASRLGFNRENIGIAERPQILRTRVESLQQFLTKAGFDFQAVPNEVGFIATAKTRVWRTRFPKGLYIRILLDNPLDQRTVNAISQDSKKHSDHALIVINKQPDIDGWIAINTLRNQEGKNRFVCLPIDEALIQEGVALNQEQQTLQLYIHERLGKEFDPYDARDPVSGAVSFFGRQRLTEEILDALRRGQRLGLFGIHKMGKSSVLHELQKKAEFPIAYIYLNTDDDLADIYTRIVEDWALNGRVKYTDFKWAKPQLTSQSTKADFSAAVRDLLAYLGTIADTPPLLGIFLDEIEHIVPHEGDERTFKLYIDLMDTLRGLQQETKSFALLVAGIHPSIARRNYFWGNRKNPMHQVIVEKFLPPLDEEDCSYMIRSLGQQINLRYEENAIKHILHMSGSHPFLARQICSRAYKKRRDTNAISAQIIEEVVQEFIRHPATASYFDEHGLWGELSQADLWGEEISKANHAILRTLASSIQDLSEDELYIDLDKKVAIHAFHALKERGIIHSPDNSGYYCIAFGLFRDWIRFHQLDSETWNI